MGALLEVRDLSLGFGGIQALAGVDVAIAEGETLAVIGPNGSGKTSLFNCVTGIYHPTGGTVTLEGESLLGLSPDAVTRRGVARTFQNLRLFHNLSVVDNLLVGRHLHFRRSFLHALLRVRGEEVRHRGHCETIIEFLNLELGLARLGRVQDHVAGITDTLVFAKELHPGKKNSLDALCERYFVDNSRRTLHGALADAYLLAECYLAMTRGQESLMMELDASGAAAAAAAGIILDVSKLIVQRASAEELAAHEQYLDAMEKDAKGPSLWRKLAL